MKRSDDEQLIDELVGEAVLSLLKSKSAINTRALISKLRMMFMSEQNLQRQALLSRIFHELEDTASQTLADKRDKALRSSVVHANQRNAKKIH